MKLLLKLGLGLVVLLMMAVGGYAAYVDATWDKADYSALPKPAIKASSDSEVIKRGEYLVHSVAHCSICHVPEEVTMARKPGEHPVMSGGYEWRMGPMGTLRSRNITPDPDTGIGAWTDEELARAIRWGVDRHGKSLTFMTLSVPPMADEDLQAVISYLRNTQPVRKVNVPHDPRFFGKLFVKMVTPDFRKPFVESQKYVAAGEEPTLARGEYLANGPAFCFSCHTPFNMMSLKLEGARFSGNADPEPDHKDDTMVYRMPNLTPDPETGIIAKWDEEQFVTRFRAGRLKPTSKMPWEAFREMTDHDLRSIYRYLHSLPPTRHYVGPTWRKASEDPAKDTAAKT